jgi:hypothetical protein
MFYLPTGVPLVGFLLPVRGKCRGKWKQAPAAAFWF